MQAWDGCQKDLQSPECLSFRDKGHHSGHLLKKPLNLGSNLRMRTHLIPLRQGTGCLDKALCDQVAEFIALEVSVHQPDLGDGQQLDEGLKNSIPAAVL